MSLSLVVVCISFLLILPLVLLPQTQSLALYGRPKIDGELKICSSEKRSKQDRCVCGWRMSHLICYKLFFDVAFVCALLFVRYAFLFDKAVFICKKKSGETFELKEIIELHSYQIRDETTGEKDNKKVSKSALRHLLHTKQDRHKASQ